jgi:hypothetical protein
MCLRGLIFGALLVIGGAYLHDSLITPSPAVGAEQRQLVNWDVVSENLKHLAARVQQEWDRLTG